MKTILGIATWSGLLLGQSLQAQEVNIYLPHQPFLIEPFLTAFTEETGIATKALHSKKGLAQRFKNEGRTSLVDVALTIDIARRSAYNSMGLLAQAAPEILKNKKTAVKLLEFLSQERFQQLYSEINFEHPANAFVKPTEELASWGGIQRGPIAHRNDCEIVSSGANGD